MSAPRFRILRPVVMEVDCAFRVPRAGWVAAMVVVLASVPGCDGSANNRAAAPDTTTASTAVASRSDSEVARLGSEIAERIESFVDPTTNAPFRPLRAVLIETDGHTVLERYHRGTASDTSNVFSVTASVVGTLIGIALSDGSLRSVDQTLGELLPPLPLTWDPRKPLSRCGNCSR